MAQQNFPFTINPTLSAIALAYANGELIADRVLPRVPVPKPLFLYMSYPVGDTFTVPDTRVGRTSKPNQVELSGQQVQGQVFDHALDIPVAQADVQAAEGTPYDPDARATMIVSNLLELDREVRVAGAVFNAANYGASNKTTLSGTGQWSDPASKPIIAILNAMDSMVMRPTKMVVGQLVATQLQTNPNVVAAILGNAGTVGVVPLSAVAQVLGLREIIVGPSFVNTAKPGQTATLSRVWGKFAALICQDPLATPDMGTTFGYTAQWGTRIAGTIADSDMGMRGGHRVRAGESVNEIITAPDLGYLFSAAVA